MPEDFDRLKAQKDRIVNAAFDDLLAAFDHSVAGVHLLDGPRPSYELYDAAEWHTRGISQGLKIARTILVENLKLRAAALDAAPSPQMLLTALKRVTEHMDRAGGDGYGMPECPWCKCQFGDYSDDRADHLPECELALARQVIADVEAGIGAAALARSAPAEKLKKAKDDDQARVDSVPSSGD